MNNLTINPEMAAQDQAIDLTRLGYISPEEAAQAIRILRAVEDRLGKDSSRLAACLGFARDAVWTAAFPDDPAGLLSVIAHQAEIAMG